MFGLAFVGIYAPIASLDLSMVKKKLMEPEPEGKGWTQQQVDEAELWYKRFLHLIHAHPNASVVPNYPIDTIWHQHILDTRAYADDCQNIFGCFIHHFPYFGIRGDEDKKNRDDAFDLTNMLYREHFGIDCRSMKLFKKKSRAAEMCIATLTGFDGSQQSINASGCAAPCIPEACSGGGTCQPCTVDRKLSGDDDRPTSCRQSCRHSGPVLSAGCSHSGSGTGCGQGCGRGR